MYTHVGGKGRRCRVIRGGLNSSDCACIYFTENKGLLPKHSTALYQLGCSLSFACGPLGMKCFFTSIQIKDFSKGLQEQEGMV